MSAQKNFLPLMVIVISFITLKNVHSFSDYKQFPLRVKYNHDHEIKQQSYEINNSYEGQNYVSSRFFRENTEVITNRNLVGHDRIPRQNPSRKLNTLHFHWGYGTNRYGRLRKSRLSDRAIDARGVSLRRSIPMNVLTNLFLMMSLNVIINVIVLVI